jgi:hypothetical protein
LVVQYALGLLLPDCPLQVPVPGQTWCLGLAAKTVLANEGAIIIAAAAATMTIANVSFVLFIYCEYYTEYTL